MKAFKNLIVFLLVSLFLVMSAGCNGGEVSGKGSETHGNYTDEMKIPYSVDLSQEDGADHVEREGDHKDSPYFSRLDFYNMKSTDTLTIIPKFKTMQQTSEWSCGGRGGAHGDAALWQTWRRNGGILVVVPFKRPCG